MTLLIEDLVIKNNILTDQVEHMHQALERLQTISERLEIRVMSLEAQTAIKSGDSEPRVIYKPIDFKPESMMAK